MKTTEIRAADLSDKAVKAKTGKTLAQWYAYLEFRGGIDKGRREHVTHLYSEANLDEWWSVTVVVEYEKHKHQVEKDGMPKGYSICSTKTVAAPVAKVFESFGNPKSLDAWLGPKSKATFKDGGSFENGAGDKGTFERIRPNKDIRLIWNNEKLAPGTKVEVLFADKGKGKTGITLNHTRIASRHDADQLRAGWSAAFDKLKEFLENG